MRESRPGGSPRRTAVAVVTTAALLLTGCPSNKPVASIAPVPKPFANVTLKIAGSDAALMKALFSRAQGWAARNDAKVELTTGPADVRILGPAEVGAAAAKSEIFTIPEELKAGEHPMQWDQFLRAYRDRLASWAGVPYAIPLAGAGTVLVVRTDLLADPALTAKYLTTFGKALPVPPATWEDVAEIAETFAALGRTALPGFQLTDFLRAAACYDRPVLTETDRMRLSQDAKSLGGILSFFHDATTGEPRLTTPGFVQAAALMKRLHAGRMRKDAPDDAVSALKDGTIAMAFLNLQQVGQLAQLPVTKSLLIAPLPGTRSAWDVATGKFGDFTARPGGNYIPYFDGGAFGAVSKACAQPAAAWDLLADLAGPGRSLDLLSDVALGRGPCRTDHLQQAADAVWPRYGFDAARSVALGESLKRGIAVATVNPAYALRGPDAASAMEKLSAALQLSNDGKVSPAEAMVAANEAFIKLNDQHPDAKTWRRRAAGLE